MKLTVDRQERKGTFGGTYYESYIKVTLEPKEEEIARKQRIMTSIMVGTNDTDSPLFFKMMDLRGQRKLSMEDLTRGFTAKAGNGSKLGNLAWLEDQVRSSCKSFKSNVTADRMFAPEGKKFEEEI